MAEQEVSVEVEEQQDRKEVEASSRDERSVFLNNVVHTVQKHDIEEFFSSCGPIVTVTIKGTRNGITTTAFIEFNSVVAASNALILNGAIFLGRELRVDKKRTNLPFMGKQKKFFHNNSMIPTPQQLYFQQQMLMQQMFSGQFAQPYNQGYYQEPYRGQAQRYREERK